MPIAIGFLVESHDQGTWDGSAWVHNGTVTSLANLVETLDGWHQLQATIVIDPTLTLRHNRCVLCLRVDNVLMLIPWYVIFS